MNFQPMIATGFQIAGACLLSQMPITSAGIATNSGRGYRGPGASTIVECWSDQYEYLESGAGQAATESLCRDFALQCGSGAAIEVSHQVFEAKSRRVEEVQAVAPSLAPSDIIAVVRSSLSLQVKELADVLGVERPTIYSWIRGETEPQKANWDELRRILAVAEMWNRLSNSPVGKSLKSIGADGRSLLEILKDRNVTPKAIHARLEALSKESNGATRKRTITEVLQNRGVDIGKIRTDDSVFDVVTGRPMFED